MLHGTYVDEGRKQTSPLHASLRLLLSPPTLPRPHSAVCQTYSHHHCVSRVSVCPRVIQEGRRLTVSKRKVISCVEDLDEFDQFLLEKVSLRSSMSCRVCTFSHKHTRVAHTHAHTHTRTHTHAHALPAACSVLIPPPAPPPSNPTPLPFHHQVGVLQDSTDGGVGEAFKIAMMQFHTSIIASLSLQIQVMIVYAHVHSYMH